MVAMRQRDLSPSRAEGGELPSAVDPTDLDTVSDNSGKLRLAAPIAPAVVLFVRNRSVLMFLVNRALLNAMLRIRLPFHSVGDLQMPAWGIEGISGDVRIGRLAARNSSLGRIGYMRLGSCCTLFHG